MTEEVEGLGPHARAAVAAIDAMKHWTRGGPVTVREMSDLIYSEAGEGVALRTMHGAETDATPAWSALTIAAMYVAWQAYRATGERMPEDVSEVDESTLDMLDEHWRATGSYDRELVRAASTIPCDRSKD